MPLKPEILDCVAADLLTVPPVESKVHKKKKPGCLFVLFSRHLSLEPDSTSNIQQAHNMYFLNK